MSLGAGVFVRYATPDDAQSIITILQEAADYQRSLGAPSWNATAIGPTYVAELMDAGECVTACWDGRIIGTMAVQWSDHIFWPDRNDNAAGYLHRIAVRRDYAGGRATAPLMAFAEREAIRRNKCFLRLDCAPLPKLMAVYQRCGFSQIDTRVIHEMGRDFTVARFELRL